MMKKTAIALGLAMVTGAGMAAQGSTATGVGVDAGVNAVGNQARVNTSASANTQFNALDRNGDGVLSRAEASANESVSALYDSLDTSETIEDRAKEGTPHGITREQFEAGLQAQSSGSGSVGPAVSGGETYTIMRDGSRKLKESAGNTANRVKSQTGDAVSGAVGGVTGAVNGASANSRTNANASANTGADVGANTRSEAAVQRERAQSKAQQMQDRARGGVGQARSEAEMQRDQARDKASTMQERARGQMQNQSGEAYGETRSRVNGAVDSTRSQPQSGGYGTGVEAGADADARINAN
ncbi:hypothetical protein SADO_11089 [Salinisphaera dokdonensis CL-ES53]|uniref:EF-hand domain-containing protein n=1 Tax=Salinisphaera dokdonensis CL-ES53 TaxID=1304272 RepID=A0ABV2B326_9GAMM